MDAVVWSSFYPGHHEAKGLLDVICLLLGGAAAPPTPPLRATIQVQRVYTFKVEWL